MDLKLKTENDGPMDKAVENGESCQHRESQLVAKEAAPHPTHSFKWCLNRKLPSFVTCNQAGTVEDSLNRSALFRTTAGKNRRRELVILRDGKAISSHFPCHLIKTELLTVQYIKTVDKQRQPGSGSFRPCRKGSSGELVIFDVLAKGGKNVVKIMKNPALKAIAQDITVYAYKGETVKQALKRDGRFLNTVFKKNCVLSHKITQVNTEMSNLVDDLDGKTYKIILLNKFSPPESQPGSLDDAYMMPDKSQRSDSDGNQGPSEQSTTTESVNDNMMENKPQTNGNTAAQTTFHEIPDSGNMQNHLSSVFKHLVDGMKTLPKLSRIQNLLRVEYGKNAETCTEVKTMKKLMVRSTSVCQVRINGSPEGSGFLLFDKFVLTNCHVLQEIYNENRRQHYERVTVHFSYESLDQKESGKEHGAEVEVEEMVVSELGPDVSGHVYDWALLRLRANQTLPEGLLKHFGFLPQSGGICIIGHPDGGVKKIDAGLIIPSDSRDQVVEKHYHKNLRNFQLITQRFFEGVAKSIQPERHLLTYKSCFYFGSSGSPVFNKYCKVVAMHSGGYHYPDTGNKHHHFVEFGYCLSNIIEHIIVQLVNREKFDVLKAYLACSYAHHQDMMSNLKQLVESRNFIKFKNALSSSVVANDASLKMFFEFFCQKEENIPMDIV
ncbi:serine protease FAM111A-like [Xiphias gladius]|uniref:serine protease FAM111A-like n=1 Tax=Xiphias gladius TaxID=8245 RepID=UPI001A9A18A5|nr:serine protease FAM111A-like [Xiphias gladius]